jgi:hypothetical protein
VNYATNTWLDRSFAFERDKKPLYWSTNAYNDMGRALAMMQWIKPDWLFWESAPTNYTLGVDYTDTTNGVWNGNYLGGEWVGGSGSVSDSGAEMTIQVWIQFTVQDGFNGSGLTRRDDLGMPAPAYWYYGTGPDSELPKFDYEITIQGSIRGRRPYMYINPPGKVFDMTNFMLYADNLVYNFTTNMLPGNPTAQPNRTNGYLTAVAVDAPIVNNYFVYGDYLWNPTNLPPSTNWIQSVLSGIDWAGIHAQNITWWTNLCVGLSGNPYLDPGSFYYAGMSPPVWWIFDKRYGWKSSDSGYGSARFKFQTFTNFTNYLPIR